MVVEFTDCDIFNANLVSVVLLFLVQIFIASGLRPFEEASILSGAEEKIEKRSLPPSLKVIYILKKSSKGLNCLSEFFGFFFFGAGKLNNAKYQGR